MSMPTAADYQKLLDSIREINRAYNAADDDDHKARLMAGLELGRAFMRYLHRDTDVLDGCLTRAFGALESAVYDAGQGANPPLLQHTPTRTGKPELTSREAVQGILAGALETLKIGQVGLEAAGDWIAKEARKLRVLSEEHAPIPAKQIKGWRKEFMHGRGAKGAVETYENLQRENRAYLKKLPATKQRKAAEALALAAIKTLAATTPEAAPEQNRQTD